MRSQRAIHPNVGKVVSETWVGEDDDDGDDDDDDDDDGSRKNAGRVNAS